MFSCVRSLILYPWPWTLLELAWAFLTDEQLEELGVLQRKGDGVSENQQSQLLRRGMICLWQLGIQEAAYGETVLAG